MTDTIIEDLIKENQMLKDKLFGKLLVKKGKQFFDDDGNLYCTASRDIYAGQPGGWEGLGLEFQEGMHPVTGEVIRSQELLEMLNGKRNG